MTRLLAVDPGPVESAFAVIDVDTFRPIEVGKAPNDFVLDLLEAYAGYADHVAIEMIASYGMPVGKEVFDTCVWIGRFWQQWEQWNGRDPVLVYRSDVKLNLCHSARAKDANVTQALVDRFAPGAPNKGKGTKAEPGWFHGFHSDIWAAYAVGVTAIDLGRLG